MPPPRSPLLGRLAVHNRLVTLDQLEEALREQGLRGGTANLGDILVEKGFLTPKQLAALVRAQCELVEDLGLPASLARFTTYPQCS